MKTRCQNSCCIGRLADKSGLRPQVRNQTGVETYASGTNVPKDSLQGYQHCVKANSEHSETTTSSNQKDLKRKNGPGKSTKKSWKPTTMQNIIPQMKVIQSKHIRSGGKII